MFAAEKSDQSQDDTQSSFMEYLRGLHLHRMDNANPTNR